MPPETKVSGIHDPKHLSGLPGEEAIAIDCLLVLPEGKGTPVVTSKTVIYWSLTRILEAMGGCMYLDFSDCFCSSRTSSKSGFEGLPAL